MVIKYKLKTGVPKAVWGHAVEQFSSVANILLRHRALRSKSSPAEKAGCGFSAAIACPGFSAIFHPFSPHVNLSCVSPSKRYRLTAYTFCAIATRDFKSKIVNSDLSGLNLSGLRDSKSSINKYSLTAYTFVTITIWFFIKSIKYKNY